MNKADAEDDDVYEKCWVCANDNPKMMFLCRCDKNICKQKYGNCAQEHWPVCPDPPPAFVKKTATQEKLNQSFASARENDEGAARAATGSEPISKMEKENMELGWGGSDY